MKYAHAILSLGLSVLINKIPRKYKWLLFGLLIVNEIRGLIIAWQGFKLIF